ncbi:hypothetical protein ACVWZ0_003356 [Erwinia sp. TECH1]
MSSLNFYDGFHVGHKGLEAKLIVSLEHEPDTEKMELAEFFLQYIVTVEAKVILNFVMHHYAKVIVINMQLFYGDTRCPSIMNSDTHAIKIILETVKFREFPAEDYFF